MSQEISSLKDSFNWQLNSIQTSVENLSHKVNTQYSDLNAIVQQLSDTIQRQNLVKAGIQQDFKLNMTSLTQSLQSLLIEHQSAFTRELLWSVAPG
jgi:hypothetical protein